jgi:hypothetical protein
LSACPRMVWSLSCWTSNIVAGCNVDRNLWLWPKTSKTSLGFMNQNAFWNRLCKCTRKGQIKPLEELGRFSVHTKSILKWCPLSACFGMFLHQNCCWDHWRSISFLIYISTILPLFSIKSNV